MRYTDGREVPGFVVGAPLAVRGVGPYELYQLFPLDTEQETLCPGAQRHRGRRACSSSSGWPAWRRWSPS